MNDPQERITAFWSTVAADYEEHGGNVPRLESAEHAAWMDALRDLLPPAPADVLDVATGTGYLALLEAAIGHRVTGIDLAVPMLDEAEAARRRLGLRAAFRYGDAVEPPFGPETFDAITSRHFLWTLRRPETAFSNWYRLLRTGGRVVAIDGFWFASPEDEDEPADTPSLFGEHYTQEVRKALPGMSMRSPEPMAELFRAAGFVDVSVRDLAQVHALAEDPPGAEPWYVIVAAKPE